MPEKVSSLLKLMSYMIDADHRLQPELQAAVAKCAVKVQTTAKSKFGTYQDATPPFDAWPDLAPITIEKKMDAGATDDDPLIGHYTDEEKADHGRAGGGLRDSIMVEVKGLMGYVGTNDKIADDHEFGTKRIPARPFLRPALVENEEYIKDTLRAAIAKGLNKL